jgi:integrase
MTVKVRLQLLHTALQWAADQKLLPEVPHFDAVRVPKKKPQPVPVESFERLLAKATGDRPMQAFLLCGWLAGLRRNETLMLEWERNDQVPHLDFDRDRIVLPAEFVKGVEDQAVAIDPELRGFLETLPRHGRKVFQLTNTRGELLTPSGVSLVITKLAKAAGVKPSMKVLRKGFGRRYAGKVPAQVLQKLRRHANISTTMDYYANIDEAAEAIPGPKRNRRRNTQAQPAPEGTQNVDANAEPGAPFDRGHESLQQGVLVLL